MNEPVNAPLMPEESSAPVILPGVVHMEISRVFGAGNKNPLMLNMFPSDTFISTLTLLVAFFAEFPPWCWLCITALSAYTAMSGESVMGKGLYLSWGGRKQRKRVMIFVEMGQVGRVNNIQKQFSTFFFSQHTGTYHFASCDLPLWF